MSTPIPIYLLSEQTLDDNILTLGGQSLLNWSQHLRFGKEGGARHIIRPDEHGHPSFVLAKVPSDIHLWSCAELATHLPEGDYTFSDEYLGRKLEEKTWVELALGWHLDHYMFDRYKKDERHLPHLMMTQTVERKMQPFLEAVTLVRDLINTPPADMGPEELAAAASTLAKTHKARIEITEGKKLEKEYPAVYAVGKGSSRAPRLIDIRWGSKDAPRLTLVGKGVCFDTGGLDIKTASGMLLMKKDMGGAANVLGLGHLIMSHQLPVQLRILIPAVENAVDGNAFRPSDILTMRNGLSVEIGNTDAEGRLVLADAISDACDESPDLLIDCATLTGAARVALGTDLPALFSNRQPLAEELVKISHQLQDPLWQLPLYEPYMEMLASPIADCNNTSSSSYAGAITAALFLKQFVKKDINWLHLDMMAWNVKTRPGRPLGGEAMAIRSLFYWLVNRYARA